MFTGIATFISQIFRREQIALGIAVAIWIFFQVVYGVLVLGTTLYLSPKTLKTALIFELLGNPIDIFRVVSLIAVGGLEFFGPAGATLLKMVGSESAAIMIGIAALLIWILLPLSPISSLFYKTRSLKSLIQAY